MSAQTPLIGNLKKNHYMEIIPNVKATLGERLAKIDILQVHKAFAEEQKITQQSQKVNAEVSKMPRLPRRLGKITPRKGSRS
jgi:hypothetical protein